MALIREIVRRGTKGLKLIANVSAGASADVLLVLDDLSYDAKAFRAKGNVLGDLWRNGRHAPPRSNPTPVPLLLQSHLLSVMLTLNIRRRIC